MGQRPPMPNYNITNCSQLLAVGRAYDSPRKSKSSLSERQLLFVPANRRLMSMTKTYFDIELAGAFFYWAVADWDYWIKLLFGDWRTRSVFSWKAFSEWILGIISCSWRWKKSTIVWMIRRRMMIELMKGMTWLV